MTDQNYYYYYYYYFVDEKLTRKIYQIEKERTKRRNWNNQKKRHSNQMEAIIHPEMHAKKKIGKE